jgi:hypothetical protein
MVPVDYFQPLSFQQANPILGGMQAGQQLFSQGMQNDYLRQNLQQAMQRAQLQNQQLGIQNQYMPQQLQANIGLTGAQTGLAGAEAQENLARIPVEQAQAWQIKNFPITEGAPGQLAYLNYIGQTQGTNSPAYKLNAANLAAQINELNNRAAFFGANVGLKNVPTADKNAMIGSGYQPGYSAAPMMNIGPDGSINMMPTPMPNQQAPQAPAQGQPTPAPATVISGGQNSYDPAILQKTAQTSANQELTTATQRNRYQAGVALENLTQTPDAVQAFQTLANYSGMQGTLKAQMQRFTDPNAYLQYQSAQEQFGTMVSGGLKVLEGYPSTDQSVGVVKNYFTKAQGLLKTDPAAAMNYFNQGLQYLKDETGSLQKVNQPIFQNQNTYNQPATHTPIPTNANPNGQAAITKVLNGQTYTKINGQWYAQ